MPGARGARAVAGLVLVLVTLVPLTAWAASPKGIDARLRDVHTFAFALGDRVQQVERLDELARYDLVVLDGELAPAALIEGLRARGVIVLGYVSVGTIERGRVWTHDAKPFRLDHWDDWDEWFAETSNPGFRALITDMVAPAILDRGFDGLFLDNVDMIENHPRQRDGMSTLVHALGGLVHGRRGLLFAQNGEDTISPMLDALDGWNREDVTGTYDFDTHRYTEQRPSDTRAAQRALRRIAGAGLLVTATDYGPRGDSKGAARATGNACAAGALSYVSGIELNRLPAQPPRC